MSLLNMKFKTLAKKTVSFSDPVKGSTLGMFAME